jgi:DNA-binding transcriptional LysR family regulator
MAPAGPGVQDAENLEWIGWQDETYNGMLTRAHYPSPCIRHRVDDMLAMCAMARNGMGVAMLPCYVGDTDAGLRRIVKAPILEGMMDLWVLSHPDVRKAARVRAFTAYIAESILSNRDLFEGGRPRVEYSALSGT